MTNYIDGAEVAPLQQISSELDVVTAIRAAQRAQVDWARRPAIERADLVRTAFDDAEIARAAACGRDPLGVVGVILPRARAARTLKPWAAALLTAGNALVIKPSSRGADEVRALIPTLAKLPAGVCNIVFGAGEPVGRFLVEHPGVPAIAFAGTSETGRKIMAQAAPQLKRLHLKLGAKNAAIVLKDADLNAAARTLARWAFADGGVDPFAVGKILVQQDVFDAFLNLLTAAAPDAVDGSPDFDRWVALARAENGRVTGGAREGSRVTPALVSELTNCSEIHQTELLQPLVTINSIKYPADGVKWANTSPYGLAGAVWTANVELGRKLARQLIVGTAWVNGWFDPANPAPLGVGARASAAGLSDILDLGTRQTVVVG